MKRIFNHWLLPALFISTSLAGTYVLAADTVEPGQTGAFTVSFTERSSLTAHKLLARRMGLTKEADIGDDYDLSTQPFAVYVPAKPEPDTRPSTDQKYGILLFLSNEGRPDTPTPLHDEFDKRQLIFITNTKGNLNSGQALGLSIDAVWNLEQRYPIDPNRVYFMGTCGWSNYVGLAASDVFMGCAYLWVEGYYGKVPQPNGGYIVPNMSPVSRDMTAIAKRRAQVLGFETHNRGELKEQYYDGYVRDGFKHVYKEFVPQDEMNFPTMKADWFAQIMTEFESAHPKDGRPATMPSIRHTSANAKAPGVAAASDAAVSAAEADHLLKLGQMYLDNGQPDLAKSKLEELVKDFPGDPDAEKAKAILSKLN